MTEHIKMPAVTPIVRYVADGIQTIFSYPFPIFASEDLAVYLGGAKQIAGFDIAGAGNTAGGSVTFDAAPAEDTIITLARELPIERMTDFLEGGDFSAQAINNELDYLVAAIQQVERQNNTMLRYGDHEAPGDVILPSKSLRANKALGFDGDGDPIAVDVTGGGGGGPVDFTASGTGAVTRSSSDKFADLISIKDFGAVGDGLTNDTLAIQQALAAHDTVFIPAGTYLITSTIALGSRKTLIGAGQKSVIKANTNLFNTLEIRADYNTVQNLRIEGGLVGIKLFGSSGPCVQNNISDVQIMGASTGILLDGHNDSNKPCYWNNFARALIEQPLTHGVHLTLTGAGDTPNANRFHAVRVFSKGAGTTGSGFYVEDGSFNNSFFDCEANVNGPTADSCFRLGAGSNKTLLVNLLTESTNTVPNVKLDSGSLETAIVNLTSQSDGAAIWDLSGGNYDAINSGYPDKNRFKRTTVTDLKATLMRLDTEFIDTPGTTSIDLSHTVHIVNAIMGAIEIELPPAADAAAACVTVKKVDGSANIVSITEDGGDGPDGKTIQLGGPNDYVCMISNGAAWYITASNRASGNTRYHDGTGTYDIDMAVDTYLLSSFSGTMTARLPPADAVEAVGRTITIKKIDTSGNTITVSEQGGTGPDNSVQYLSSQYKAITVISDGGQWFIVSKF
jgi:hypothetical protein